MALEPLGLTIYIWHKNGALLTLLHSFGMEPFKPQQSDTFLGNKIDELGRSGRLETR